MKKTTTYIILICISAFHIVTASAQDIFLEKQKGFNYKRPYILDSLNIKEPNFNVIDIELRVYYTCFGVVDTINSKFIQIAKEKNGLWNGKSYSYYYYNDSHYNYKDVNVKYLSCEGWDDTWQAIIKNNYLNLPTEWDIKRERKPLVFVADGDSYTIEVLTKKRKRRISYGNPEVMYESCWEYGLSCYEYKSFMQLIKLLRTGLDLKFSCSAF